MKYLLLLFLSLSNPVVYAVDFSPLKPVSKDGGSSAGDGGHSIWCKSESNFAELLDLYEARRYYHIQPSAASMKLPGVNGWDGLFMFDLTAVVLRAGDALGLSHPFVKLISDSTVAVRSGLDFDLQAVPITLDPGGSILPIPNDCEVLQAGRRFRPFAGASYRFEVNRELLKWMLPVDQEALFVHEIVHEWFSPKLLRSTLAERQTVMYLFAHDDFRRRNRNVFRTLIDGGMAVDPAAFH